MRNVRVDCAAAGAISVGLGVISVGVPIGASRSGGAALDERGFAWLGDLLVGFGGG